MTGDSSPERSRLVADYLLAESISAERAICRFAVVIVTIGAAYQVVQLLAGTLLPTAAVAEITICLTIIAWYGSLARRLSAGWFHPAICWINVTLEMLACSAAVAVDVVTRGPEVGLSSGTVTFWTVGILLCAFRADRRLGWYAGILATVEYLMVDRLLALPRFPGGPPVAFALPAAILRAWPLFSAGVLAYILSARFSRKIGEVVATIRSRDLMGKYLLHERIGAGGMAEVFRATYSPEGGFERRVAVKRILPDFSNDSGFVRMFRREAELGSLLHHPNVVQVLDLGSQNGAYFLVMEYVDGRTLGSLLAEGRQLPFPVVAYLGAEVASALDYIHGQAGPDGLPLGLVHRDVNPPNILVSRLGEVKLGDFGIARADQETLTNAGQVRGKSSYLSPEQLRGEKLDGRSDLFALGLTLYEALTGSRAIQGTNQERFRAVLGGTIPRPSTLRPGIPPELEKIVMLLLARDLNDRTADAATLRRQLQMLLGEAAPYTDGRAQLARLVGAAETTQPLPDKAQEDEISTRKV